MLNILSYIHPISTYAPCTGVGRHINNIIIELSKRNDVDINLFFSEQWLNSDGKLDPRSPLTSLSFTTFPTNENRTERSWKMFGFPRMDRYITDRTDWLYAPMQTYIPVAKCPVAVTIHDVQAFEPDLPWSHTWQHRWFAYRWGLWVRKAFADCRVIFTVSEFSKQRMVDLLGVNPDRIEVVGNGVDLAFFEIGKIDLAYLKSSIDRPYIIIVGGLREKKGADYVLGVAKILSQRNSELEIVVAGDSEASYVEAAQQYPNIKLLGMVADEQLPHLVRCASSLLFLSPYEGFGIPALEAMAAGVPTVVSDRASLPEIVGDAGIVVNPTIAEPIVDILIDLDRIPQLRADYIQRGRDRAASYTWSSCADRVISAFHTFA